MHNFKVYKLPKYRQEGESLSSVISGESLFEAIKQCIPKAELHKIEKVMFLPPNSEVLAVRPPTETPPASLGAALEEIERQGVVIEHLRLALEKVEEKAYRLIGKELVVIARSALKDVS